MFSICDYIIASLTNTLESSEESDDKDWLSYPRIFFGSILRKSSLPRSPGTYSSMDVLLLKSRSLLWREDRLELEAAVSIEDLDFFLSMLLFRVAGKQSLTPIRLIKLV